MSKRVAPTELGDALGEVLTLYAQDVADGVNAVGEETIVRPSPLWRGSCLLLRDVYLTYAPAEPLIFFLRCVKQPSERPFDGDRVWVDAEEICVLPHKFG